MNFGLGGACTCREKIHRPSVAQTCAVQAIGRDNELPLYKLDIRPQPAFRGGPEANKDEANCRLGAGPNIECGDGPTVVDLSAAHVRATLICSLNSRDTDRSPESWPRQ